MPTAPHDESPAPAARPGSATVHHVARLAGVSTITVSRALREPAKLAPDTLARVRRAIADTGYVPNSAAGTLRMARSGFVAALVPHLQASNFGQLSAGLTEVLSAHGYQLLIGEIGYGGGREDELLRAALGRRPEGLVITGVRHSPAGRALLRQAGIPIVETWDLADEPIDMRVGASHERIGEAACDHLVQRGRRCLALVSADDERSLRRAASFLQRAAELGLPAPVALTVEAPSTHAQGRAALAELLARAPDVDAVCCSSDLLAMGVLTEARVRGIEVPRRLAVMGGGDAEFAASLAPSLTSIRIDGRETGRQAGQMLVARLQQRPLPQRQVDVGFELMVREST
ncbi:LacI family DNA-binding transcriptional regulator [Aquincola tertiaricarbonis]|uniref:LacI family DNA-binding transcriptional regulator n=1 Tax=Aquincola tertiaricarbonis TaxID=391953 RepID=A0ABY4RZR9_AQUTE|nr:LacI family DNA-binding transcriptional regulator [Aquincola tertiaricarbonis]URI06473.1 LacI family DNA-binding transcriptional regulator [Aquincola tertiaricarbonis]